MCLQPLPIPSTISTRVHSDGADHRRPFCPVASLKSIDPHYRPYHFLATPCAVDRMRFCSSGPALQPASVSVSSFDTDATDPGCFVCSGGKSARQMPAMAQLAVPLPTKVGELGNPLDLSSAIAHELQKSNEQQALSAWKQQLAATNTYSTRAPALPMSMNAFPPQPSMPGRMLYQIPRFDDSMVDVTDSMDSDSFSRGNGYSLTSVPMSSSEDPRRRTHRPLMNPVYSDEAQRVETLAASFSPWLERMIQEEEAGPTHGTAQQAGTSASCAMSRAGELSTPTSGYEPGSDRFRRPAPEKHNYEIEDADRYTDDDMEPVLIDEKRKKRMLSNRASAQRSRQKRQERLDQLEVLTAQLRVENSTLLRKANLASQVAKKFEDENKQLLKEVEELTKELKEGKSQPLTVNVPAEECTSSRHTTCASSSEMVGGGSPPESPSIKGAHQSKSSSRCTGSASYPEVKTTADVHNVCKCTGNSKAYEKAARHYGRVPGSYSTDCREEKKRPSGILTRSISLPASYQVGVPSVQGSSSQPQVYTNLMTDPVTSGLLSQQGTELTYFFQETCESLETGLHSSVKEKELDSIEEKWLESFAEYLNP